MAHTAGNIGVLPGRAAAGDGRAVAELFERHRGRLEPMVRLWLDRRLQRRLDPADVLQEVFLDLTRRLPDYLARPTLPFVLWLRLLTGQKLVDLHRQHLGTKMRDAGLEVALHRGASPRASSASLAERLLGRHPGRDAAPRPAGARRQGPHRPRGPGPAPLREAEQRRGRPGARPRALGRQQPPPPRLEAAQGDPGRGARRRRRGGVSGHRPRRGRTPP